MAECIGTEKIENQLAEILNVLNVIAESLQCPTEVSVAEMGSYQRETALREVLRQEMMKKCQEGFVVQIQQLLESYGASCISEVKAEDITNVLALVMTYHE